VSGSPAPRYFITGGAGFIGAHLVNRLLETTAATVTVFDNFSNGRRWAFGERLGDPRLAIVEGDAADQAALVRAIAGHDVVYHFAANPDIARAAREPAIDFVNGTLLTHNVVEAMRQTGVRRILFSSGSGVYGEVPPVPIPEEYPRMIPISTYGAGKLASESLISAYCHMFELTGTAFRFANVVGPHQTHGVAHDFLRRLAKDPSRLLILGDGQQTKPYIHIDDVLAAFQLMESGQGSGYDVFNVGTDDSLTVRQIADIVVEQMGLEGVRYEFTGGARGWKADVPVYKLDTRKIRGRGWSSVRDSRQAVTDAVAAMLRDLEAGNLTPAA
jgi:UDP-glucose 4-epimerase